MAHFGRVEPDGDEGVSVGQGLLEGGHGRVRAEMAQEAQDQRRRDAEAGSSVLEGPVQAADDRLQRDAALGVGLGIEEDLSSPDVLGRRPLQVGAGQVVEVLLLAQHGAGRVIDVEEGVQVAEHKGAPDGVH